MTWHRHRYTIQLYVIIMPTPIIYPITNLDSACVLKITFVLCAYLDIGAGIQSPYNNLIYWLMLITMEIFSTFFIVCRCHFKATLKSNNRFKGWYTTITVLFFLRIFTRLCYAIIHFDAILIELLVLGNA